MVPVGSSSSSGGGLSDVVGHSKAKEAIRESVILPAVRSVVAQLTVSRLSFIIVGNVIAFVSSPGPSSSPASSPLRAGSSSSARRGTGRQCWPGLWRRRRG